MKNKSFLLIFNILILYSLSSCISPKETNLLQDLPENYPNDGITSIDYKIIPGDQLTLYIFTLDEEMRTLFAPFVINTPMSESRQQQQGGQGQSQGGGMHEDLPLNVFTVSPTGMVKIPYLGNVYVMNMTILEAKKVIGERFRDFSTNVSVDLALRNRSFYVIGELGYRTVYMPHLRMTIFQALAQTGDMQMYGDRKNVKIIRQKASGTEVKVFDIRSKEIVNSDYYYIQPNDVIYVPQMGRKFWGAPTSFTGIFGFVMGFAGAVLLVWNTIDQIK